LSTVLTGNEKPRKPPKKKDRKGKHPKLLALTMVGDGMPSGDVGAKPCLLLTHKSACAGVGVSIDSAILDSIESMCEDEANVTGYHDSGGRHRAKRYERVAGDAQDPG